MKITHELCGSISVTYFMGGEAITYTETIYYNSFNYYKDFNF